MIRRMNVQIHVHFEKWAGYRDGVAAFAAANAEYKNGRDRQALAVASVTTTAYLPSCDGPGGAFFVSCAPIPIFFRNGWTDCFRPRNFSMDTLTSRESPTS